MKFRKIDIPNPHPWVYPSRYSSLLLEGSAKSLSEEEKSQIKQCRDAWIPSKNAYSLFEYLKHSLGKRFLLQVQNPENYYDSPNELPKHFIAELKDAKIEKVLDIDMEFDQLYILLSSPRHTNGESVFKIYNFDYQSLLKPQVGDDYWLNFSSVIGLSVEKANFWKQFFMNKNGS